MATSVATILSNAARQCSVPAPESWLGSLLDVQTELRDDFLPDVVEDVRQRVEWTAPIAKTTTITGDGSENYALPSDFLRLQRDDLAVYERNRTRRPCVPVTTDGEWEYMKELGSAGAYRYYRLRGYEGAFTMDFYQAPSASETIVISYISDVWIVNAGTEKAEFTDDADMCLLPKRLLESGIVYRFRERKGLAFQDKYAEYEAQLARFANDRRSVRVVDMAGGQVRSPWDVPVPDVIPTS